MNELVWLDGMGFSSMVLVDKQTRKLTGLRATVNKTNNGYELFKYSGGEPSDAAPVGQPYQTLQEAKDACKDLIP